MKETRALEAIWLETHRESSFVVECEAPALAHVWPEARDAAGVQCSVAGAAGLSPEPLSWRWSPLTAAAAAEPPTEQQLDFYTSVRRMVLTCAKPATLMIGYSGACQGISCFRWLLNAPFKKKVSMILCSINIVGGGSQSTAGMQEKVRVFYRLKYRSAGVYQPTSNTGCGRWT